ncbi:MAG: AtpZ/AtpI family protein [Phycisphaerales bacterium]|nr:AtpZ/AtpI family protein [Phycisphaerales bacterium]
MSVPPEMPEELRSKEDEIPPYSAPDLETRRQDRYRQAKAWAIALDPVYGLIGMGLVGYAIDWMAGTGKTWTVALSIAGLLGGFYLFIKEASKLNREQTRSSSRTDGDRNT